MKVSAIVVSRGNVDIKPIVNSLPQEWEILTWENGKSARTWHDGRWGVVGDAPNRSVYGRYAAIEYASGDLIYVQDDDCIVSEPQAIVDEYERQMAMKWVGGVVCNMPAEFRHDFYEDHALVGFGAAFHRDAPIQAFTRFSAIWDEYYHDDSTPAISGERGLFDRTCDIVFTALTARVLVDVPKTNLDYAYGEDRMWRQPQHQAERAGVLELVKKVPW